jgi:hypothetical protein
MRMFPTLGFIIRNRYIFHHILSDKGLTPSMALSAIEANQRSICDLRRAGGVPPAFAKFAEIYKSVGANVVGMAAGLQSNTGNLMYWFTGLKEFLPYALHEFDLGEMERRKDLLMLANRDATDPSAPQQMGNEVLGEKLGIKVERFPEGHVEYVDHPVGFASALVDALQRRNGKI